jgi:acyl-CoA thioesterase-2
VSPGAFSLSTPPNAGDGSLARATLSTLDSLLVALTLEPMGGDRFRAPAETDRFDRVFGGQVVAQALLAAGATVIGKDPDSLHAYFVEAGVPGEPVDVLVERVRDGRSISTRRATVMQGKRQLLVAILSFHAGGPEPGLSATPASDPGPEGLPLLQDWARDVSPEQRLYGLSWIEHPPPLEIRMDEPPNFMGGPASQGTRTHWMRLPRDVGDDPLLHTALLAYASDYLLLDMVLRAYPDRAALTSSACFSLDHSLWFHRPARLDHWHRHTQETQAISGLRGLVRGAIHDADGLLVASAMQEGLLRPAP